MGLLDQPFIQQRVGEGVLWGNSYGQTNTGSVAESNIDGIFAQLLGCEVKNLSYSAVTTHDPVSGYGRLATLLPMPWTAGPDLPRRGWGVAVHGINDLLYVADGKVWRNYLRLFASLMRASRLMPYNDAGIVTGRLEVTDARFP